MATALDEAKRQRELTKDSLSRNLDRLETRVRSELDWKARLRRDGGRYAVYGVVAVAGLAGLFVLRRAVSGGEDGSEREFADAGTVAAELATLRAAIKELDKHRKSESPVWQKLAVRAVSAGAAAAATAAVRKFMRPEDAEPFSGR